MSKRAFLYTLILVVLWGSHSAVATLTFTRGGGEALSRHAFLFYKLLLASVCLFVVLILTGRLRLLGRYSVKRLAKLVFAGFFGYFMYYFLYFWALGLARPQDAVAEAVIINYLFPMCTLLACAAIIGEKLTVRALISAVICFVGVYVVVSKGDFSRVIFEHPLVDLLALLAAVSWGVFSALGRRWRHEPLTGMFIFVSTALVVSGIVLLFTGGRRYPIGWEFYGTFHVGVLCNTVGVMLWFGALRHGGASLVGNLSLLSAFVALVFIRVLLPNQTIPLVAVGGLLIVTGGVLLSRTGKRRPKAPREPAEPPG